MRRQQIRNALRDRRGWIGGRGSNLVEMNPRAGFVQQREVREGSADVDAYPIQRTLIVFHPEIG